MNLGEIRNSYLAEGFSFINANSRTCQDVVLALIGESYLAKNVTVTYSHHLLVRIRSLLEVGAS